MKLWCPLLALFLQASPVATAVATAASLSAASSSVFLDEASLRALEQSLPPAVRRARSASSSSSGGGRSAAREGGGDNAHGVRPHFGEGQPEVISFGIFAKQVFDIDFVKGTFKADMVVTLRWKDPRVTSQLKGLGESKVTLPLEDARRRIWLPNVMVSNRDLYGFDIISTAVTVDAGGTVEKVERILANLQSNFGTASFPFDRQELHATLASAILMSNELLFEPLKEDPYSGVTEGAMNTSNFNLVSWKLGTFIEVDGRLRKSRAELRLVVDRRSWPHIQSLIVPKLLVLAIACSVFWLPPLAAFVMPRVATAVISFLTLTTLGLSTNSMVPIRGPGGMSWIDLFENSCQTIVLFTLLLNILVLIVFHSFKEEAIGYRMDYELSLASIAVALLIFSGCFYVRDGSSLFLLSVCNLVVCSGGSLAYFLLTVFRVRESIRKKSKESAESSA